MTPLRLLIVGAGRRVQEDWLPVVASLAGRVELLGVGARSSRTLAPRAPGGQTLAVTALDELLAGGVLARCDLLAVIVAKPAVPTVLAKLGRAPQRPPLLLETPGLLFKHLGHLRKLAPFPAVSISEDCAFLPWVDLVVRASRRGPLGPLREVVLDRSAWRYHGVALAKALCDASVRRGRRRTVPGGGRIELVLDGGARATIVEPRDYSAGHVLVVGRDAAASDAPRLHPGALPLELRRDARGVPQAIALGPELEELLPVERGLLDALPPTAGVTAHTHGWKRIGLRRLLLRHAEGLPGYALGEGLDDMAIDMALEKLGAYLATPLTSLRTRAGRALLSTLLAPLALD